MIDYSIVKHSALVHSSSILLLCTLHRNSNLFNFTRSTCTNYFDNVLNQGHYERRSLKIKNKNQQIRVLLIANPACTVHSASQFFFVEQ
mmetsp:Transcript_12647/g.29913  ORF Transcript_12647/g.29913 Transcript_12647/m.29913 type:complete len:89 (-) Transcript_12647:1194-1460(-)